MAQGKGIFKEFEQFALRGNVVDLAVGVIVGAAFGKIVDSLVKDIVMPIVNFLVGGSVDFSNKYIVLSRPAQYAGPETYADLAKAGANLFAWGNFLTIVINFVLLAFVIFFMVKAINTARAKMDLATPPLPPPSTPEDIELLREIRDSLKK
jgi:large conductance mechanosensitive channel